MTCRNKHFKPLNSFVEDDDERGKDYEEIDEEEDPVQNAPDNTPFHGDTVPLFLLMHAIEQLTHKTSNVTHVTFDGDSQVQRCRVNCVLPEYRSVNAVRIIPVVPVDRGSPGFSALPYLLTGTDGRGGSCCGRSWRGATFCQDSDDLMQVFHLEFVIFHFGTIERRSGASPAASPTAITALCSWHGVASESWRLLMFRWLC